MGASKSQRFVALGFIGITVFITSLAIVFYFLWLSTPLTAYSTVCYTVKHISYHDDFFFSSGLDASLVLSISFAFLCWKSQVKSKVCLAVAFSSFLVLNFLYLWSSQYLPCYLPLPSSLEFFSFRNFDYTAVALFATLALSLLYFLPSKIRAFQLLSLVLLPLPLDVRMFSPNYYNLYWVGVLENTPLNHFSNIYLLVSCLAVLVISSLINFGKRIFK